MATIQTVLYLVAVILLAVAAALVVRSHPTAITLALLGAATALLAYALPTMQAGFH